LEAAAQPLHALGFQTLRSQTKKVHFCTNKIGLYSFSEFFWKTQKRTPFPPHGHGHGPLEDKANTSLEVMTYVQEVVEDPAHIEAAKQLEQLIQLLQDGDFESIVAQEPKAVELAEKIAVKAPGLSGKIYGNLSSAYLSLRRYDQAVAKSKRHLEIWQHASHLPEQHSVLLSQIAGYKEFDGRDLTYLLQSACSKADWHAALALKDRIEVYMEDPAVDKGWASEIANNLGLVYLQLKQLSQAKTYMSKALEFAQGAGDENLIAATTKNLARVDTQQTKLR
jgi:tetratricopeptide (TPR) repeat protein